METATLTHDFSSWPCHAVIFKALLSTSFASWLGWGTQLEACCGPSEGCYLWDCLKTETPCISCERLHISFHNTYGFLFNYLTASAYFHRCVLCRESLIDSSVKSQYATVSIEQVNFCQISITKYFFVQNMGKYSWL